MKFTLPSSNGYTVYIKSGCSYCMKVKELLKNFNLQYTIVNCDEYLLDDTDGFLAFINERVGKDYKTFPMVFSDGIFLGGYTDTKAAIDTKSD